MVVLVIGFGVTTIFTIQRESALVVEQAKMAARRLTATLVASIEGAMLQERPTRPALSREEALSTLKENWGMRYDPEVVRSFVEVIEEELRSGEHPKEKRFALFSV